MLVLSRKTSETVLIGDSIRVTVVRIGPNNVRLGFQAPREMLIIREEVEARPTPIDSAQQIVEINA